MSDLNIYQRINKVREEVEYIRKDATIDNKYAAITHDQVTAHVRDALIKHGIVLVPSIIASETVDRQFKNGTPYVQFRGNYQIEVVNMDNPADKFTMVVPAHADDMSDKAPGKATSYATKYSMLKLFNLETGENEESRVEEQRRGYTPAEKTYFDAIVEGDDAIGLRLFSLRAGEEAYKALYNSGEKGQKVKLKERCDALEQRGIDEISGIKQTIINDDSLGAAELLDGISNAGFRLLLEECGDENRQFLKDALSSARAQ